MTLYESLIGIVFKSHASGAVYYWEKGAQVAEVIVPFPTRETGLKIPCNNTMFGVRENEIIVLPSGRPESWEVVKVIYLPEKK